MKKWTGRDKGLYIKGQGRERMNGSRGGEGPIKY